MIPNLQLRSLNTLASPWTSGIPAPPPGPGGAVEPTDVAMLQGTAPAAAPEPTRSSKGRILALVGLGCVALGVGASLIPGPMAAPLAGATVSATSASSAKETAEPETPCAHDDYVALSLQGMTVGEAPAVRAFGPEAKGLKIDSQTDRTMRVADGRGISLTQTTSTLRGADGQALFSSDGLGWVGETFGNEAVKDWSVQSTLEPAGSVGRFASVKLTEGGTMGGASEVNQAYRTVDTKAGRVVTLDEVLEPADLDTVIETIQQRLSAHPDGQRWLHDPDVLREEVGASFAIYQDGGKTMLQVAVPPVYDFDAGHVATFTFQMPSAVLD